MKRPQMIYFCAAVLLIAAARITYAGDDASGRIPHSVDLSKPFTVYSMTSKDRLWSEALVKKFKYKGPVVHFVRTSLPLKVGERRLDSVVYQALERPEFFYVLPSDTMLKIGHQWAYSPGVGGFSMHAPKSRNFIVCLNFVSGGVPYLSSSPVRKGLVRWMADDDRDRLH